MYTSFVASLDEKFDIGVHERHGHRDSRPIRKNKVGVLTEFLDDTEDVIPSAAVESSTVVSKLENDLFFGLALIPQ